MAALRSPNRRVAIIPRDDLRTWEALNLPRLELLTDFGGYEIATTRQVTLRIDRADPVPTVPSVERCTIEPANLP